MAGKKETAGSGVEQMEPELAFAGFEPDPIDDEDFSDADRGHEIVDEAAVEAQRKANEEEGEGEPDIPVVDKSEPSKASSDDGVDPAEAKAAADKARKEADADDEPEETAEADNEEPEVSAEADIKDEPEPEPEGKPKGQMIPKSRFDEVNERRKLAEQELARLKAQEEAGEQAQAEEYDFEGKEKEYMNLVLDGEHDKAASLRSEIRHAEKASFMADARDTSVGTTQDALDRQAILEYTTKVVAEYPAFDNNDAENYREDLIEDVGYQTQVYVDKGFNRPAAFERAVQDVVKLNDLDPATKPATDPAPEPGERPPAQKKSTAKKVEVAAKQPANIADAGQSGSEQGLKNIDVNKISDADLEKLPAETVARLRGDYM